MEPLSYVTHCPELGTKVITISQQPNALLLLCPLYKLENWGVEGLIKQVSPLACGEDAVTINYATRAYRLQQQNALHMLSVNWTLT